MTTPASDVCGFHFGSHIKKTVFTQQFPWLGEQAFLWAVKLSGWLTVETSTRERVQMKQWDVWTAPSTGEGRVTHLLWPQGVLNRSVQQHTLTHWVALSPTHGSTRRYCLHLSRKWMVEGYCVCVCVSGSVHLHLFQCVRVCACVFFILYLCTWALFVWIFLAGFCISYQQNCFCTCVWTVIWREQRERGGRGRKRGRETEHHYFTVLTSLSQPR